MSLHVQDQRLKRLKRDLEAIRRGRIARQADIAESVGIAQETVSKAKTGRLKHWTPAAEALAQHAEMLLGRVTLPPLVEQRLRGFLAAGGRQEDLCTIIETATDLVTGHR